MIDTIRKTIIRNNLINSGDTVLVGLSGGADSVSLLHSLWSMRNELGINICAAHINHGIRGDEAKRDERFANRLCDDMGIECYTLCVNVKEIAKKDGISEELAGRKVRYAFFDELSKKYNITKKATAHNKNDNAETIMLNFMRGSTISGLSGIPYKRGNIIRPLLDVTREEIEAYCKNNSLEYVTDSTNNERLYTRNKIRLDLIPYISENFNPSFMSSVTKNAVFMGEDEEFLQNEAKKLIEKDKINVEKLNSSHRAVSRRAVYMLLKKTAGEADLSSGYVEDILELAKKNKSGQRLDLPSMTEALISYGTLYIRKKSAEITDFEYELEIGKECCIPQIGMKILIEENKNGELAIDEGCKITVRNRREGDYFCPVGMNGTKKVKDYFIDEKIPKDKRSSVPLLTFDGEIGYIIGKRRDRRFAFGKKRIKVNYTYCNKNDNMLE